MRKAAQYPMLIATLRHFAVLHDGCSDERSGAGDGYLQCHVLADGDGGAYRGGSVSADAP